MCVINDELVSINLRHLVHRHLENIIKTKKIEIKRRRHSPIVVDQLPIKFTYLFLVFIFIKVAYESSHILLIYFVNTMSDRQTERY